MSDTTFTIPVSLANSCQHAPETMTWLKGLPAVIEEARDRWELELEEPFDGEEVSCSWVALAKQKDGTEAVLKIGMPHMEGLHELEGLLFWDGDHCVRVLKYIDEPRVMLLERCMPGTRLRELTEPEQDEIIAGLLKKLWQTPVAPHAFRPLSEMIKIIQKEALEDEDTWTDPGLIRAGIEVFDDLIQTTTDSALLAVDLHAGNVLRAQRAPWLVIDPKPFVGDPAFDATQHLFNCRPRLYADPAGTIGRMSSLMDVPFERVKRWMFARAAVKPRRHKSNKELLSFARAIAP